MAWLLLFAAGAVEVVMALALKQAAGWTRPLPSAIGVTVLGIALYGESAAPARLLCIALIAAGIAGLRLLEP